MTGMKVKAGKLLGWALLFTWIGACLAGACLAVQDKASVNIKDETAAAIGKVLKETDQTLQRRFFLQLEVERQVSLLNRAAEEDAARMFAWLEPAQQVPVFIRLDPGRQAYLFGLLAENEQVKLFASLTDDAKRNLLNALAPELRRKWLARYPGLGLLVTPLPEEPSAKPEPGQPSAYQPSRLERIMSGRFPSAIEPGLRQFGYDFFSGPGERFKSWADFPVDDSYVLGPGDSFSVHLWGKVEQVHRAVVERDGTVSLPRIGQVVVAGLSFGQVKKLLKEKFSQYYPDFSMGLTMQRLRSIQVYVVGAVQRPGAYPLSSLSTVIQALYAAGGPTKNGSLRKVKVNRAGKTIATVDLYAFLIGGDRSGDLRLHTGDTVVVPVIGPVVGVAGNVRRPAIYELNGPATIGQVLELAGGVMATGYLHNIVVERVERNQRRIVKSFNLAGQEALQGADSGMAVQDGDLIKVYPVHRQMNDVVFLEGHVKYPREYELKPGMRVKDLIRGYDDLLPEPFLERADIIRLVPPDLHPKVISFDLGGLLEGDPKQNIPLQNLDRVIVYAYQEKAPVAHVNIRGAVQKPGTYRLYDGMRVKDLIFMAGNLTANAYLEEATLSRIVSGKQRTETVIIKFSPSKAIGGDPDENMALRPDDSVFIRRIPKYGEALERKVTLEGEFRFPGEYFFTEGERISHIIARAGGLTEDAYLFGAVFQREEVKAVQGRLVKEYISKLEEEVLTLAAQSAQTSLEEEETAIILKTLNAKRQLLEKMRSAKPTGRMVVDLQKIIQMPNSDFDLKLQPGDRLIVRKRPDYVNVLGEVYNQTALLVVPGKKVGYYLAKVGGTTDTADEKQIYLVRADGTVISKRQAGFFGLSTWDSEHDRWQLGSFEDLQVHPGDTIIVPKKVEKYPWLRVVKSVTQIMYQIAVAAGVIIVAY